MPGALTLASLPYKYTTWARTLTAATTATTASPSANTKIFTQTSWRCRISSCVSPAHFGNPHRSSKSCFSAKQYNQENLKGFGGLKIPFSTSSKRSISMGPRNYSSKDDQWLKSDFSPTSPPPPTSPPEDYDRRHDSQAQSSKLLTLPTILTIGRVAAIPLLVSTFYVDSWWGPTATTSIFIAAAITDWLDGYLARKMKLGTTFGAFLDPVADKLMVAATLILLCTKPLEAGTFAQAPWLLTVPAIAIIGREITMSAVREWAASQGSKLSEAVAVNNLGKWKTATQMTALTVLLATRDSSIAGTETLVASGVILLYISAWLSVSSLFVYMRKIWKVLVV